MVSVMVSVMVSLRVSVMSSFFLSFYSFFKELKLEITNLNINYYYKHVYECQLFIKKFLDKLQNRSSNHFFFFIQYHNVLFIFYLILNMFFIFLYSFYFLFYLSFSFSSPFWGIIRVRIKGQCKGQG